MPIPITKPILCHVVPRQAPTQRQGPQYKYCIMHAAVYILCLHYLSIPRSSDASGFLFGRAWLTSRTEQNAISFS